MVGSIANMPPLQVMGPVGGEEHAVRRLGDHKGRPQGRPYRPRPAPKTKEAGDRPPASRFVNPTRDSIETELARACHGPTKVVVTVLR